ncbi:MAG: DUF4159 domain-containing protein [Gemmatimonadaceae bacterium]
MRSSLTLSLVSLVLFAATTAAQGGRRPNRDFGYGMQGQLGGDGYYAPPDFRGNPLYDGRVTFVRIKWRGFEHFTNQGAGWAHDYPISETHFAKIMKEITSTRPFVEAGPIFGSAIIAFDDPLLFKYPIAYVSEPGGWHMNATELAGFKKYIERGGFLIFDDMQNYDIQNLNYEWQRAFPKAKILPIPAEHPVFDSFFKIDLNKIEGAYRNRPTFWGYFEDNDSTKRLIAVINNDQDLGEFMEYSDTGFNVGPTNEAYKLVINYFIYALSH